MLVRFRLVSAKPGTYQLWHGWKPIFRWRRIENIPLAASLDPYHDEYIGFTLNTILGGFSDQRLLKFASLLGLGLSAFRSTPFSEWSDPRHEVLI